MCLYYNKKNKAHGWHFAKEDIVCYKVLQVYKRDTEFFGSVYEYSTPYFNMPVRLGETYNNTEEVVETNADDEYFVSLGFYNENGVNKVTGGVYHSFSQVSSAKWLGDYRLGQTLIPGGFIIVKCIIPKGAEFVFGYDGYGCPCFGSKTLTITHEVLVIQDSGPGFLGGLKGEYPDAEYWERNPCGL